MINYFKGKLSSVFYVWFTFFVLFAAYVMWLSYLYPYGADEYFLTPYSLKDIAIRWYQYYLNEVARVGHIYALTVLYLGKWSFIILNPVVQIIWIISCFFLIKLRIPDFKSLKDFPIFLLIAILALTVSAQPDNTLFWIGGATNYSWSFIPFFWIMAYLRIQYQNKGNLILNTKTVIFLFIAALLLGMSSENNGPLVLGWIVCLWLYSFWAKFKFKKSFYLISLGLVLGITFLFTAPALYTRLNAEGFKYFHESSLPQHIFWHIGHIHWFIKAMLLIPVFNFLALLICALDKDKPSFIKDNNFFFSLIFFISGVILAFVLFAIPVISARCFYTASIANILSFIFILAYLDETYNSKTVKYAAILALCVFIAFIPAISYPYVYMHKAEKNRIEHIQKAKNQGKPFVYVMPYKYPKGPNNNLTIFLYDPLMFIPIYANHFGIYIITNEKERLNMRYSGMENPNAI